MSFQLPARQMVSQADQSMIARPDVPRSKFTGSWTRKTTFQVGKLIPFCVDEVLPGDHLTYRTTAYCRLSTPLFPIMSNMRVDTFWFFVPMRLVWANAKKFFGEQVSPGDSIAYTIPYLDSAAGGFPVNSLYDYMGLPTVGQVTAGQTVRVNSLPMRCYALIYDQWFRDQNSIATGGGLFTTDGPDGVANFIIFRRAKSHDYFTTCLPWPQKFTAPTALGSQAPVVGLGVPSPAANVASGALHIGTIAPSQIGGLFTPANVSAVQLVATATNAGNAPLAVYADLSGISVNVLRESLMVQTLLERDARGGTRYTEVVKAHFGVQSPDARLQRSEYIGGGSAMLNVTPIAQTATGGGGLGALGGAGTAYGEHSASVAATEHGYVIGIINARSELSYSQGLHKMWTRSTRYDFYWPSLAQLGEQAVLRQEIYCTGVDADDTTVFGYQERWHEYRTRTSEVTGLFRPTSAGNIDEWHLSEQFTGAPVLGATFLEEPYLNVRRALSAGATADEMQILADILIQREAVRPLPMFGTPASLGRF